MTYKSSLYGAAIALIFIIVDVFFRISQSEPNIGSATLDLPVINNIEQQHQKNIDIVSLYKKFDVIEKQQPTKQIKTVVPKVKEKLGIGEENEQQQNGTLTNLYFGENNITLSGVFSNGEYFAVVAIRKLADNSVKIIKLFKNQKLFDYTVTAINHKSINLTRNNQKIKLNLFEK